MRFVIRGLFALFLQAAQNQEPTTVNRLQVFIRQLCHISTPANRKIYGAAVYYSPTNAQVIVLKTILKFTLK
jgi:phenylalanine-4-hydroxylase